VSVSERSGNDFFFFAGKVGCWGRGKSGKNVRWFGGGIVHWLVGGLTHGGSRGRKKM